MTSESSGAVTSASSAPPLLTFLIADVRGYTQFTAEHGDEAAARLAGRFAELAEEVVERHEGNVIELRGDEALCIFPSARSALRAAVALQSAFRNATESDPSLPLRVGMGLDAGEAIPIKGGYRGGALNLAARLCSIAGAGEVLICATVGGLARKTEGLAFVDRGPVALKGLSAAVRVLQVAPEGELPTELPPLQPVLITRPNNLPDDLTPFIGREGEIAAISSLLREPHARLVTLTGPGGIGKTRLALQVGNMLLYDFQDGVIFCDLAALSHPGLVPSAIARVLRVQEDAARDSTRTLIDALASLHLLLVLDNFEHVLDARSVVADLLTGCRRLHILVTSRIPLHLSREREHTVPPLSVPESGQLESAALTKYESVTLFIDRAQAARDSFTLTDDNGPTIAAICSRLDGLPLAIELAAARVKLLPPQAILQRLSSRLALLTGGAKDRPTRQQTLRGTIDWSYSLLAEEEQALFARLAVFAGGWTFEAAEAVCNLEGDLDLFRETESLVDKSLVQQDGEEEPRFSMLESVREYAAEKLAERGEHLGVRSAHAAYFTELAESVAPKLYGPDQTVWLDRLQQEHGNLRAVLDWSLREGNPVFALRLAGAMALFWSDRGHVLEGRLWLEMILAGDVGAGTSSRARALDTAGMLARFQGDFAHARLLLEEGLSVYRQASDRRGEGMALAHLGGLARLEGDLDRAAQLLEECVALEREVGDLNYHTSALTNLGEVRMRQGSYAEARRMLDEALALRRKIGDRAAVGQTLTALGRVEQLRGDGDRAATCYRDALVEVRAVGSVPWIVEALEGLASVSGDLGAVTRAARLRGAVAAIHERLRPPGAAVGGDDSGPAKGAVDQRAETEWKTAWLEGHALGLEEAIDYALTSE